MYQTVVKTNNPELFVRSAGQLQVVFCHVITMAAIILYLNAGGSIPEQLAAFKADAKFLYIFNVILCA